MINRVARRFAAASAAAGFVLAVLPGAAVAAPVTPTADSVLSSLAALNGKNYTLTLTGPAVVALTFRSESPKRFSFVGSDGEERRYDNSQYGVLNIREIAQAQKAKKQWRWYKFDSVGDSIDVKSKLGALPWAVKYGVASLEKSTMTVTADFTDLTFTESEQMDLYMSAGNVANVKYVITLDSKGRAVKIVADEFLRNGNYEGVSNWTATFSYAKVRITPPPASQITTLEAVELLPELDPLEYAAYNTAFTVSRISYESQKPVTLPIIERASLGELPPPGLEATYIKNGLKYTLNGRSLCITPDSARKAAVVKRC